MRSDVTRFTWQGVRHGPWRGRPCGTDRTTSIKAKRRKFWRTIFFHAWLPWFRFSRFVTQYAWLWRSALSCDVTNVRYNAVFVLFFNLLLYSVHYLVVIDVVQFDKIIIALFRLVQSHCSKKCRCLWRIINIEKTAFCSWLPYVFLVHKLDLRIYQVLQHTTI